ncbi:MAG: hypothetical protein K9H61_08760 [Bacteroidia bacterium]|nr:hypothetical protein [Bacteroidia bacterium]MCF8426319.1 hypothetical protein [Bacteroidia bacterium]MCF8447070.1 hypothetical protein [Bacteroidia bacterium]
MEQKSKIIQEQFLQRVKSAVAPNVSFVDELADLLKLSNDSAYRRIRCETLFNIEEITMICKHFRVSFDPDVQHMSNKVTFDYLKLDDKKENFRLWLMFLSADVKKIGTSPNNQILYGADDVPVWHHFFDKELIAFKLFYWLKSILNSPEFADKNYDPSLIDEDMVNSAKEMLQNYNQINSVEIWTEDTLNSNLKQIEYFWESGFFDKKQDALRMCDLYIEELNLVQKKATSSSKLIGKGESKKENFKLYKSEVMIGNNSILANIGSTKIAYVSNNTFNMMSTTSADFVHENELWLNNLLKKSTLISGVGEKQRNQFFRVLREKVEIVKQKISLG